MKRTKYLLAVGALGLWTLALGQEPGKRPLLEIVPSPSGTVAGRYVLFQGAAAVQGGSPRVFRLDTMTGRCWYLMGVAVESGLGGQVDTWVQTVEMDAAVQMGVKGPAKR